MTQQIALEGDPSLERIARGEGLALCASGSWTARFAPALERLVTEAEQLGGSKPNVSIDVSGIARLDTFGAWLIERLRRNLGQDGTEARIAGLSTNYASLVDEVRQVSEAGPEPRRGGSLRAPIERLGRTIYAFIDDIVALISMMGAVLAAYCGWWSGRPRSG